VKILVALTYYHPHWTGLTKVARHVAEGMAARGHEVTVLTSRFRSDLAPREVVNGVRVVRLPVLARVSRGTLMPTFPWVAARLVRSHEVVQIHTPMLEAPYLTSLARAVGIRSVITHHGDLVMPSGVFDQTVERLVTALLRQALRQADRAVVYTRDYLEHSPFLAPFAAKCVPIWPPVAAAEPDFAAARSWRMELGLDRHRLVGFAGRFVEEKGFDFLLKAVPLLARDVPDVRFVYAGERNVVYEGFFEHCRPLLERAAPHVIFLGLLREPQRLANFYAMCDVIAVPSRTDNLPLVPLEAMLCGTPAVVADIPGARMAVRRGNMGRLVPPGDGRALAEGLREVLLERSRFVKPRAEVEALFDLRGSLDEYERALTEFPRRGVPAA
jgi:glycosyltransferase involved in cell wall biosynthesis